MILSGIVKVSFRSIVIAFCWALAPFFVLAQPEPGVYHAEEILDSGTRNYRLMISDNYVIHSVFETSPAHFLETKGGYFQVEGDSLFLDLEFNSNLEADQIREQRFHFSYTGGNLILNGNESRLYRRMAKVEQALDGAWLFATRGPDEGQDRRGDENPRKTLKFLIDGYFQWTAYNVEDMRFMGCGGGRYAADQGAYIEMIEYFSRDDSRVGAELSFTFDRQGNDWHHTGNNSRGEPMYEIWAIR